MPPSSTPPSTSTTPPSATSGSSSASSTSSRSTVLHGGDGDDLAIFGAADDPADSTRTRSRLPNSSSSGSSSAATSAGKGGPLPSVPTAIANGKLAGEAAVAPSLLWTATAPSTAAAAATSTANTSARAAAIPPPRANSGHDRFRANSMSGSSSRSSLSSMSGPGGTPNASSASSASSSSSSALAAPKKDNPSSKSYMTPVAFGALPIALSYVLGGADIFAEIFLTLVTAYLIYKAIKTPWELYYMYNSARLEAQGGVDAYGRDERSIRELRTMERILVMVVCIVPFAIGIVLRVYRMGFPQYARILNDFNIVLFVLCASISPMQLLFGLARHHVRSVQQRMYYPHQEIAALKTRVNILERRLDSLRTRAVSQQELIDVQDVIKPILTQLLRAVKNVEDRNHEIERTVHHRLIAVETSLGLSSPPPNTFTEPYVEWTVARATRSLMRMVLAPILFPAQMINTTWQVITKPLFPSNKALPPSQPYSSSHAGLDDLGETDDSM